MTTKKVSSNSPGIEAIGFDFFNTLITVRPQAMDLAMERLWTSLMQSSITVDFASFTREHHLAAQEHLRIARQNRRETHNRFWISTALCRLGHNIRAADKRISLAVEAYFSAFSDHSCLIPDTLRMLSTLKDRYRLGILSNFTHAPALRKILDDLNLAQYFQALLISDELGYRKPKDSVFKALLKALDVDKDKLIYIGDDPECDIDGAYEAGIESIWMTYVRDSNIPLAPGPGSTRRQTPLNKTRRISSWLDLFDLLPISP